MLKDGRKSYVKAGDVVSQVQDISSSTIMSDKAKIEVVFSQFEEF